MEKNKILIVDDERDFVEVVKKHLEAFDYEVSSAFSGSEGLRKAVKYAPDLILLDIVMPGMDGFQVLSALKNNPGTQNIPVVMLSGKDDIDSVLKSGGLGMADYIMKPFDEITDLLIVIRKHLK
jgi:DNA-binding response OmpR family regulator